MKRDYSQSRSGSPARTLEPRDTSDLICGQLRGGGHSDTFQFTTERAILLKWRFENDRGAANRQVVRIKRVHSDNPSLLVFVQGIDFFAFSSSLVTRKIISSLLIPKSPFSLLTLILPHHLSSFLPSLLSSSLLLFKIPLP